MLELFEQVGAIFFLYNFYREHSCVKLKIKKVIPENQCEKQKKVEFFFGRMKFWSYRTINQGVLKVQLVILK